MKIPGEKEIIFDPGNGMVQSSDFAPIKEDSKGTLSFQNILDTEKDIAILQAASVAMSLPGKMVESDCLFRGVTVHLRVIYLPSPEPQVCIFIRPAAA